MGVGVGQGNASRVGVESKGSLADDDCKASMQCAVHEPNSALSSNIHTYEKINLAPSVYKVPFMLQGSLRNYCLTKGFVHSVLC